MELLNELVAQLKKDEGFTPTAFWDYKQYTNGYGTEAKNPKEEISKQEAERRLIIRAQITLDEFNRILGNITMDKTRTLALCNMLYNLGLTSFLSFNKMLLAVKNYDWKTASKEAMNSKWYYQVGMRSQRICAQLLHGDRLYRGIKRHIK